METGQERHGSSRGEAGFTLVEILVVMMILSVIGGIAIQTAMFAFDVARLGKSVANMRQVSSAIMQYETSTSTVPVSGLTPVSSIVAALGNQAGRINPKDGWGNDLYYEDITVGENTSFRIYCYGKDGTPDGGLVPNWIDFYTDTVLENGVFIQTKW